MSPQQSFAQAGVGNQPALLTERQLKSRRGYIGEAANLWPQRCREWVDKHGDPGPAKSSGCICIWARRQSRSSPNLVVLVHTLCCVGNEATFCDTAGEVIAYLDSKGLHGCFYSPGGLLDDFSDGQPRTPMAAATPSRGNVEKVESTNADSTDSTIPREGVSFVVPTDTALTDAPANTPARPQGISIPVATTDDRQVPSIAPVVGGAEYYPHDSLVSRFHRYCCQQIESASLFIVAGALTLMSIMVGRRVFLPWGDQTIYPNLMHVLIAPSGARKSQLISIVTRFVNILRPQALLADTTSHERLVESLAEEPTRAMIYPEGKTSIDSVNRSPEMTTDFIKLADCEQISTEFKTSGRIVASAPFLTVLIGIIPEGLQINAKNLINGFLGRLMLLVADGPDRDIVNAPPAMSAERDKLIEEFRQVGRIEGEMSFAPDAAEAFATIQRDNRGRLRDNPAEVIASNLNRMPFFVVRVAMLFQIATDGKRTISGSTLRLAQQYVELQHRHYCKFVREYAVDKSIRLQERILTTLRRNNGCMSYSTLLNRVSTHGECNAAMFRAALATLEEMEKIKRVDNPDNPKARFPDVELLAPQAPTKVANDNEGNAAGAVDGSRSLALGTATETESYHSTSNPRQPVGPGA